jgi:predicted NBD/HSP70 family sugar kinase
VNAVQQRGSLTQVELAGVTGLSPATISNIVKELAAAGVLNTSPTSRSGRRAQQVTLARTLGLVGGVHFGTRSMRVAVGDTAHRIIAEQRLPLPPDHRADAGLDRAAILLTELFEQVDAPLSELLGVGVGVPAPVDVRTGRVSAIGMLRGWEGAAVPDILGDRLGAPVYVDNDANLGALAELRAGAGVGAQHIVYIQISHGVGAGLVLDGAVFHGRSGAVGEIGHITVEDHGPVCRCGNRGCLEMYVGVGQLLEMLAGSHGNLTIGEVIALAEGGDLGCRRVIDDAGQHLGVAAASICNLVDPERIIVGGELAHAGELILGPIRTVLTRRAFPSTAGPVSVVQSVLGEQAGVRGCLLLALDNATITAPSMMAQGQG